MLRTKTEMAKFVKSNAKKVSKNLKEMIDYTLKMYKDDPKLVTAQDFRGLISDINAELAEPTPQASASSVKKSEKTTKKSGKKTAKKTEKVEEAEEAKEEKPKEKPVKKSKAKKKLESGVTKSDESTTIDMAEVFKDEIETPLGVITKDDSIKSIKDVAKVLEKGEKEVMCAIYWTERHLEQFAYSSVEAISQPESFPNDLDLISIIFVAPDNSLMVGVSAYTFVPCVIENKSMKQKKGLRYNYGAEFNVYTLDAEEATDE